MNLDDSTRSVLFRLDDQEAAVWSVAEIANYLQDGYNQFCRRTRVLFDVIVAPSAPNAADHCAPWEESYLDVFFGARNYTAPWEKEWVDGGAGPAAATSPAERVFLTAPLDAGAVLPGVELSEQVIEVDRATWNGFALLPDYTRRIAPAFSSYEKQGGQPYTFTIDGDGKNFLRLIPIPPGTGTVYDYSYSGDSKEIVFSSSSTEFDDAVIDGPSDGVVLDVPGEFPEGPGGVVLDVLSETRNTRVEFFRLGMPLSSHQWEIPDAFVKYPEFFAQSKALGRDGPGQDPKLAQHFMERFELGVTRAMARVAKLQSQEAATFGRKDGGRYPSNFPANYGIPRSGP